MMSKKWTEKEDQIIRDKYPRYGTCCLEHLPGRTKVALQTRASSLGVNVTRYFKDSVVSGGVKSINHMIDFREEQSNAGYSHYD